MPQTQTHLLVFDGCAGTGSATLAFKDRGHEVETLDIVGNHTYVMDIREFHPTKSYDFMWFSPPCAEFSIANNFGLGSYKKRSPDMSIVNACFRIASEASPPYYILENPAYGLRHFIGKPTVTINYNDYGYFCRKSTDLWGDVPWFWSPVKPNENTVNLKSAKQFTKSETGIDRARSRAKVPYALSLAICKAVEEGTT